MDPGHERQGAGLLASAIKAGYIDAFCIDYAALRQQVEAMLKSDKPRIRAAGAKLNLAMANHDLKLIEIADKSKRLDLGQDTETATIRHKFIKGVDEGAV